MRTGRPRKDGELSPSYRNKMPKKETEKDKQMLSYYLSLPSSQRSNAAVAEHFGLKLDRVQLRATAFRWLDAAAARDATIVDPFVSQHQTKIDESRLKAFHYLCTALDKELMRQSLELKDSDVIERIKERDIDGAVQDWTMKDWQEFIRGLSIKAKDFKDFMNIIDGIRKVVFEWNPNQPQAKPLPGLTVPGNNNKILIHMD